MKRKPISFLEEQLKNNKNDPYRLVGDKANGYITLAYHFLVLNNNLNKKIFDSDEEKDEEFYEWLKENITNENRNFMVINLLRKYINSDDLKDFVFKPLDDRGESIFMNVIASIELDKNNYKSKLVELFQKYEIKISQKWHLCISWYAYIESGLIEKYKNYDLNKEVKISFQCSELKDWINLIYEKKL